MNSLSNIELAQILAARSPADRDEIMRLAFERVCADRQGGLCCVRIASRDELAAHGSGPIDMLKCIRLAMNVGLGEAMAGLNAGRYGSDAPYAGNITIADMIDEAWRKNFAWPCAPGWVPASIVDV